MSKFRPFNSHVAWDLKKKKKRRNWLSLNGFKFSMRAQTTIKILDTVQIEL